jgi:hypothetical protein
MDIIYNNNDKNISTDINYKNFNEFIFSNDIKIIGKLFHRNNFFNLVKDLPGDIVEIGVFKGSGVASFVKMLEIYNNNSIKKVIGFDIFNPKNANIILNSYDNVDKTNMNIVYSRVNESDRTLENVNNNLQKMGIKDKYLLIEGDVASTLPKFIEENRGFRISLLYIDVDIEEPTYNSLKFLWDRIVPGGIIVFDEYEYHKFSESSGADKFFKEYNIKYKIYSTNWMAPTAYIIKD